MTTRSRYSKWAVGLLLGSAILLPACSGTLPQELVPLAGMQEPGKYLLEPDDEAQRQGLASGTFTGVEVSDARRSLEAMLDDPDSVLVTAVAENSPGAAAGLQVGDLVFEVARGEDSWRPLRWPSEWRELELGAAPGESLRIRFDRAAREGEAEIVLVSRGRAAERRPAARYREEEKVGLVVRTATEFEARGVGLAPGAGAVIVGLTRESPWRTVDVRYGDLVAEVNGEPLRDPQQLLQAISRASEEETVQIVRVRDGERSEVAAPVSSRASSLREVSIPLLYHYERDFDRTRTSMLLGLFVHEKTKVAWKFRFLWFFRFSGGDSDRLEAVED